MTRWLGLDVLGMKSLDPFYMSPRKADMGEIPCPLLSRMTDTLCDVA